MNEQNTQNQTISIENLPTADDAMMWYVAFLPLLAIAFELFATSFFHGAFLWTLVIIVRIAVCVYDNKKLIKLGMWKDSSISKTVFFPVIYIFKRFSWLKRSSSIMVFAVASIFLGGIYNGFTDNALASDESYCEYVSEYYTSYINNLPQGDDLYLNSDGTIDTLIKTYCYGKNFSAGTEKEVNYSYEKSGSEKLVTATSTLSGQELEIRFILDHDGYYFAGLEIDSVYLGGKLLEGEEKDDLLIDIFMLSGNDEETQ